MKPEVQYHAIAEPLFILTSLAALLLVIALVHAGNVSAAPVGTVVNISDISQMYSAKLDGTIEVLNLNSTVDNGDLLVTQGNTYAQIKFIDGSIIILKPNTRFKITNYSFDEAKPKDDNSIYKLIVGTLRSISGKLSKRNPDRYQLETPAAVAGIRGTNFIASYLTDKEIKACQKSSQKSCADLKQGLYVTVTEGVIYAYNDAGSQDYFAGQSGYVASTSEAPIILKSNPNIEFNMVDKKPGEIQCSIR